MAVLVYKFRKQKNLTQEQLAPMVGISRSYLSEIETGKKHPNTRRLEQFGRALDVHPADLIEVNGEDTSVREFIRRFLSLDEARQQVAFSHLARLMEADD